MQIMGIALSALGVYVLEHRFTHHLDPHVLPENLPKVTLKTKKQRNDMLTYTMLIVSLFFFSIGSIADSYIIFHRGIHPLLALVVIQFFILFNLLMFDMFTMKDIKRKMVNPRIFMKLSFWVNIIVILCHRVVHTFALSMTPISLLNAVKQINAVFTSIIGGKFFTEKHVAKRTFGCLLITVGVIVVVIWR